MLVMSHDSVSYDGLYLKDVGNSNNLTHGFSCYDRRLCSHTWSNVYVVGYSAAACLVSVGAVCIARGERLSRLHLRRAVHSDSAGTGQQPQLHVSLKL